MREDISFTSEGLRLRGWLYRPDQPADKAPLPAIVMAHGFSAVKEMYLANFAERFAAAGFAVLVFDYRFFGDSEGEPRSQLFPLQQQDDYRAAITWLCDQPGIDPDRIGVWGSSLSGGLVCYLATYEKRIRAAVAQVPAVVNLDFRMRAYPERAQELLDMALEDRLVRHRQGVINHLKVVAGPEKPSWLKPPEALHWFTEGGKMTPNWRNEVTMESVEKVLEFDPVSLIHLVSPAALLFLPARFDNIIPLQAVEEAYERAREPKQLTVLECGHFDPYFVEPYLTHSSEAAIAWYRRHL